EPSWRDRERALSVPSLLVRPPRAHKSPRLAPGASVHAAKRSLSRDGDTGSAARTARARTARAVERGRTCVRDHELDPQRLVIAVVRRLSGSAQRIETLLFHALVGGGELGKLEDHEGTEIHLL